jgi:hypothetical protein
MRTIVAQSDSKARSSNHANWLVATATGVAAGSISRRSQKMPSMNSAPMNPNVLWVSGPQHSGELHAT